MEWVGSTSGSLERPGWRPQTSNKPDMAAASQFLQATPCPLGDQGGHAGRHDRETGSTKSVSAVEFLQCNLQHSRASSSLMSKSFSSLSRGVCLIQEPWIREDKILGLSSKGTQIHRGVTGIGTRTCILTRGLTAVNIPQFGTKDLTVVQIELTIKGKLIRVLVASVYCDITGQLPSVELEVLVNHCETSKLHLLIGGDINSHHFAWGSSDCNVRGKVFAEYLATTSLRILNHGVEPTFVVGSKQSVIDVTLASAEIAKFVGDWKVMCEETLSDHRRIRFFIQCDRPAPKYGRNLQKTNWSVYDQELQQRIGLWIGRVRTVDDIERELAIINTAILQSFDKACPWHKVSGRTRVPGWTSELTTLRKKANHAFHTAYKSKDKQDWETYKTIRREYKSSLRKCKRTSWQTFCRNIENIPEAARLNRLLGRQSGTSLGIVKLPTGKWTESTVETLQHLLSVHFPGCIQVSQKDTTSGPTELNRWVPGRNWQLASQVVTEDRIKWSFDSMVPLKTPGEDGIFPAMIQKGLKYLATPLNYIYRASLALGYIPKIWRIARVAFIPKPGRMNYSEAKAFRPISITSFLLKGMEKLIDRYLRDGPIAEMPFHPRQHAFQAGKSTESALHQLVEKLERAMSNNQFALGIFFDIEGAFNNVTSKAVQLALDERCIATPVKKWITTMLTKRSIYTTLGEDKVWVNVDRGLPQGGGLSPNLWSLVADSLLKLLNNQGTFSQGFADDGTVVIVGTFLPVICEIAQRLLGSIETWCKQRDLSVHPDKTVTVLFTKKHILDGLIPIKFYGKELEFSPHVKYLGVWLDSKLNWKKHVDTKLEKAVVAFYQAKRAVGKTWGLSPRIVHWLYTMVIRPIITYASVVWWRRTALSTVIKQLEHLQRLACLAITGAMRTTPTAAIELLVGIPPLQVVTHQAAMAACYRLYAAGQWINSGIGHMSIRRKMIEDISCLQFRSDRIKPKYYFDNNYVTVINDRDFWKDNHPPLLDEVICYTDGSRARNQAGAGIYFQREDEGLSYPLGQFCTVFQAEVHAIMTCAKHNYVSQENGSSIVICSDSQAAIKAVSNAKVTSDLVSEAVKALRELSRRNEVRLLWLPGHSGFQGNERADGLAKEGSTQRFIGPEPSLGLPTQVVKTVLRNWACREQLRLWYLKDGCRQAKSLIREPNSGLAVSLLKLKREEVRIIVGLLTGHAPLSRHLYIMKLEDDPICSFCSMEDETTFHFLGQCPAFGMKRLAIMGDVTVSTDYLARIPYSDILKFVRASGRFKS